MTTIFKSVLGLGILLTFIFQAHDSRAQIYPDAPQNIDKEELLSLVNEARSKKRKCGSKTYKAVPALVWNQQLEEAAKVQSDYQERKKKLSHRGQRGSTVGDRVVAVGYKWSYVAENVARGYSTEKGVIEGWLKSPGHCTNIMNGELKEMGVAANGSFWTQVFAKPRN